MKKSEISKEIQEMLKVANIPEDLVKKLYEAADKLTPLENYVIELEARQICDKIAFFGQERIKLAVNVVKAHLDIYLEFVKNWTPEMAKQLDRQMLRDIFKSRNSILM